MATTTTTTTQTDESWPKKRQTRQHVADVKEAIRGLTRWWMRG